MPRPVPVVATCFVTLALLAPTPPALAAEASSPPAVRLALEAHRGGGWTVAARLDGWPVTLLVDTGSTRTFVRRTIAAALDLKPVARFEIASPLGAALGLCAGDVELELGGWPVKLDCLGWRADGSDDALPAGVDGLLGWDALAGRSLLIDPAAGELWLGGSGLAAWVDGVAVPAGRAEGRPWIELTAQAGTSREAVRLRFVIDSGTDTTLLFGDAAHRLSARSSSASSLRRMTTLVGEAARAAVRLPRLRAAGLALAVGPVLLLSEVTDRVEDGLLPLQRVGAVFVDLESEVVLLDARRRSSPRPSGAELEVLAAR